MSSGKRYFWLKLKEDFFGSKRIKKLRNMAGGDTYLIIYLKLQLKAMKSDGVITYDHLEDNIVDELALDLDERPDDVAATLIYLTHCGLAESSDNETFYFPYAVENVGSENSSAARVRAYRNRQKALQSNESVTQVKRLCNGEKEKEIEKEIELEVKAPAAGGFEIDPAEAARIQEDHNDLLNAAESAGFPQNDATREKLISLYAEYGLEKVLAGIDACVDQNVPKISYLKGCIRRLDDGPRAERDPLSGGKDHEYWE